MIITAGTVLLGLGVLGLEDSVVKQIPQHVVKHSECSKLAPDSRAISLSTTSEFSAPKSLPVADRKLRCASAIASP